MKRTKEDFEFVLRLFMSVDIAGSTAYKTESQGNKGERWARTFETLFEDFPKCLSLAYEKLDKSLIRPDSGAEVWKFIGDEILFTSELHRHEQTLSHIIALISAIQETESNLKRKHLPLRLKATAWVAGFPVTNVIARLKKSTSQTNDDEIIDFLGPSIDLGFRLTQFADTRQIPVSVEMMKLLLDAHFQSSARSSIKFGYAGTKVMKGVLGGNPYPIFWVDRNNGQLLLEDEILGRDPFVKDLKAARTFVDDFLADHNLPLFIKSDDSPHYHTIPEEMESRRVALMNEEMEFQYQVAENAGNAKPPKPGQHQTKKELLRVNPSKLRKLRKKRPENLKRNGRKKI